MLVSAATVDPRRRPELTDVNGHPAAAGRSDAWRDAGAFTKPTFRALRAVRDKGGSMRLIDAMRCVEPTWIEGVAVVQAVCAQLDHGETPPAIGDIVLSRFGAVSFPLGGIIDVDVAIQAVGRLLIRFLRAGSCPLPVWEATELTRHSPMAFGSVRGVGAALTCFPAHRGPQELAAFFQQARDLVPAQPRAATHGSRGVTDPPAFVW